ncbi:MAG: hypothetical protein M4579_006112 [Chaenotheca gracillima]|nr:MAG: hypothetical protein M4579_006112 [Chaenotheca gracillima]
MPSYRSITVSLVSQLGILTIPEYAPPTHQASLRPGEGAAGPIIRLVEPSQALVSVYIPHYSCSRFWVKYSIAPPTPPGMHYYFKLFMNGRHIISWGTSEKENFLGKTMFALFDAGEDWLGIPGVEKRMLHFSGQDTSEDPISSVLEVKVFRSKGRKRLPPAPEEIAHSVAEGKGPAMGPKGVELKNGGLLGPKDPKRYYKYALVDPLDHPFATFRYYCNTWEQLENLGIISEAPEVIHSAPPSPVEWRAGRRDALEMRRDSSPTTSSNSTPSSSSDVFTDAETQKDPDAFHAITADPPKRPTRSPARPRKALASRHVPEVVQNNKSRSFRTRLPRPSSKFFFQRRSPASSKDSLPLPPLQTDRTRTPTPVLQHGIRPASARPASPLVTPGSPSRRPSSASSSKAAFRQRLRFMTPSPEKSTSRRALLQSPIQAEVLGEADEEGFESQAEESKQTSGLNQSKTGNGSRMSLLRGVVSNAMRRRDGVET